MAWQIGKIQSARPLRCFRILTWVSTTHQVCGFLTDFRQPGRRRVMQDRILRFDCAGRGSEMGGNRGLARRDCDHDQQPVSTDSWADRDGRRGGGTAARDFRDPKRSVISRVSTPRMVGCTSPVSAGSVLSAGEGHSGERSLESQNRCRVQRRCSPAL